MYMYIYIYVYIYIYFWLRIQEIPTESISTLHQRYHFVSPFSLNESTRIMETKQSLQRVVP